MCGIFGALGSHKEALLNGSCETIKNRGRDGFESLHEKGAFFAQSRLAITDVDKPTVLKHEHIVTLFNGEIYNYKALLNELGADGDERLAITLAYLRYGDSFVEYLKGMFAIALYDLQKRRLILVRDRFGKKPLFYAHTKNAFLFASKIGAVLPHLGKKSLNKEAFLDYLSFLAPAQERTFYEGVHKLEASHMAVFEDGRHTSKRYYNPLGKSINIGFEEAVSRAEKLLWHSVEARKPAETHAALFLSAGVDSALIGSFLRVPSLSMGYAGYEKYDESTEAADNANAMRLKNRRLIFTKEDFLNGIDALLDAIEEPINDPAALPLMHLCQQAQADGFKVVLTGDGGDELFLGYAFYQKLREFEVLKQIPYKPWLKNYMDAYPAKNREWEWYRRALAGEFVYRNNAECFTDFQLQELLDFEVPDGRGMRALSKIHRAYGERHDAIQWAQFADIYHHLSEVLLSKGDRIGMACGVELRSPFMDEEIVAFGLNLATDTKLDMRTTKPILRNLLEQRVNREIAHRKKKGFSYPFIEWLLDSGELDVIARVNQKTGFFKEEALQFLELQAKKGNLKRQLFGLYLFCKWFEKVF